MGKNNDRKKENSDAPWQAAFTAQVHPTSYPYETRPAPDGYLAYQIIPSPAMKIERDVEVTMADGLKLKCNIFSLSTGGSFPVILAMTPYGKDQTPPVYNPGGSFSPSAYDNYVNRLYSQASDLGHQKISTLTIFEGPDPAFWVPNGYVVMIVDQRGCFKSEGNPPTPAQMGDDLFHLIEWAGTQKWSNGNVGMVGVSALAMNQYEVASRQPPPPHLKAIIPWEGFSDRYRDASFWGGIPETNFMKRIQKASIQSLPPNVSPLEAARLWADAIDPVANQSLIAEAPKLERITVPALICASWSDKGLHSRGNFELWRRMSSKEKWLYTHGGKKWERFYSEEGAAYQKKFFDHYLKGGDNGWGETPAVRLEIRETLDEYQVRFENEFPLARTEYKKLYLDGREGSLKPVTGPKEKVVYNSTAGGSARFSCTFSEETELTGYMKVKLWVSAEDADDMDLFVTVKKFAGPCDADNEICRALEEVIQARPGIGRITKGNEIQFRGMNGFSGDMAARGQMRVSQRELDEGLSTPWHPVQKFQGEKKLKPGEIVPVEIAFLPSSTLFRKGESLSLEIQGYCPVHNTLLEYDWLINKGRHAIYTGGDYDSYLQVPVIPSH